ncbi:hydrogen peroxide-dependent heme synthase [uncultured Corynebacterium sp.]|uniref:hydrogen peroxide-dependent heme synthase n=1 Tax=uncultured Corynebacterium sp. TaxID=159447 RepID=UPI002601B105|nr:hydrogen peroxide-dependent heme synthase [uncultured Corynebacterium sp.]
MAQPDLEKLNNTQRYAQWATFRIIPGALGNDRADVIAEAKKFFAGLEEEDKVVVRGIYDISGIRSEADVMIWWHAEEFSDLQKAYNDFRRTTVFGKCLEVFWIGVGLHRPAEFNRGHLPAFIMGEEPQDWITVYPFTRSYDWYIMDADKRRQLLIEHGQAAADYKDVRANTMSAFSLGDYEWMLAFEAPTLERISDLMHKMRYTEARLHVREELPFFSGRRVKDVAEIIEVLP